MADEDKWKIIQYAKKVTHITTHVSVYTQNECGIRQTNKQTIPARTPPLTRTAKLASRLSGGTGSQRTRLLMTSNSNDDGDNCSCITWLHISSPLPAPVDASWCWPTCCSMSDIQLTEANWYGLSSSFTSVGWDTWQPCRDVFGFSNIDCPNVTVTHRWQFNYW